MQLTFEGNMNKSPQKPLLLAYIIFLFIALGYHSIAGLMGWQFSTWESIVVAATIASYAFSMSSLIKFFAKKNRTYLQLLNQYLDLAKQLRKTEVNVVSECANKEKLLESGEDIIHTTINFISSLEKQIRKNDKISFAFDVAGYLVFFCILSFDAIFNFFYPMQEFFTLVAFIIILTIEYIESVQSVKYENTFNILIKNTQDTINNLKKRTEE